MSLKLNFKGSKINEILANAFTSCSAVQSTMSCMLNFGKKGVTLQPATAARQGVMTPQQVATLAKAASDSASAKEKVEGLGAIVDSAEFETNNDGGTMHFYEGARRKFSADIPEVTTTSCGLMAPEDKRKLAHVTLTYDAEAEYKNITPEATPAPTAGTDTQLVIDVMGQRLLLRVTIGGVQHYYTNWTKDEYDNRASDYMNSNVVVRAEDKEYTLQDGLWTPKANGIGIYRAVRLSGVTKVDDYIVTTKGTKGILGLDVSDGKLVLNIRGQITTLWTAWQDPYNMSSDEYKNYDKIINAGGTLYGWNGSQFVH